MWWRHRPPEAPPPINIPHLVEKIKGFPLKAKLFPNTATYKKSRGGGVHQPPLYHGGYMTLRVRPRVKRCLKSYHYWLLTQTTRKQSRRPYDNQQRSTNLIFTGWSGTLSSFRRKSSGSWWYSKWNLWSNCNKEKWRITGFDILENNTFFSLRTLQTYPVIASFYPKSREKRQEVCKYI